MEISLGVKAQKDGALEGWADRWGALLVIACGLFMVAIGWLKWADLMVDYGAQVYLPWQIAEGRVLYRDIYYLYGPLSSHVHAALFLIFGTGIHVLVWFNLLLVAALAGLIHVLFRRSADALTGTLCALAFLVVFALAQYQGGGNFNFVTAYNYDLTHGVFLGIVTLFLYHAYLREPGTGKLVGLGLLTGLTFLTKPEAFLAVFAAMIVGLPLALYFQADTCRARFLKLTVWALSCMVMPFLFWLYLTLHMPAAAALRGLIGPWLHVFDPYTRTLPLYQWVRGVDDLPGNLLKACGYALAWAGVLGLIYGMNHWLLKKRLKPETPLIGSVLVMMLAVSLLILPIPWMELTRPLPLFVLGYGLFQLRALRRASPLHTAQSLFLLVFSIYAFVLMLKILFNVHVFHYGFALAFPAFMLFIRCLVFDWPRWAASKQELFPFTQVASAALVLVFVVAHGIMSYKLYQLKNYPVGTGADTLLDYYPFLTQRGPVVNAALGYIDKELEPGAAFPVLPGGSMLNYLSRHPNPFPFIFFTPPEVHFYKEHTYLEQLQARPPAYIAFVEMDHSMLNARYFGRDYAQTLHAWIRAHYKEAALFGEQPFSGKGYGILFMKYNPEIDHGE